HAFLLPSLLPVLEQVGNEVEVRRIFELGCGNGSVAALLHGRGWEVAGVDPSADGIRHAKENFPELNLNLGSAYDDLKETYGHFPVVLSLEVVEHVYAPRDFSRTAFDLLEPGGFLIISTPYHGYWKNLALALAGRMDDHFAPLWDHGHIKFWSIKTLKALLEETGFTDIEFHRVGRIPPLAKTMIATARKPS
ncbi:MAG TPA: class I SAM-dependent methyltransferase, partial [Mariprofundaceae bacterium]|nr:class I SAM-dependent methyltransferase [Mariprofundaceae bacterium]